MNRMLRGALALALSLVLPGPVSASEVQVVVSGKYAGNVGAYQAGGAHYLNAREAGAVYGAQVYWYPVTGRVQMGLRGRAIRFLADSTRVQTDGGAFELRAPVLVRASQAFIPAEFFLSRQFSDLAGMDSQFDPESRVLSVEKRSSVGPLRWLSYRDYTRLVLELHKGLGYSVVKHGRGGFDLVVPLGKIDWSESLSIEDGAVSALQLRQEARVARLSVRLGQEAVRWETRELDGPRRVVIDVLRKDATEPSGEGVSPPKAVEKRPTVPPLAAPQSVPLSASASTGTVAPASGMPAGTGRAEADKRQAPASTTPPKRRIVVDAGHGGKDSGTSSRKGVREKDINLSAALELAALLREEGAFDVMLTRQDDTFIPLDARSTQANAARADLFVSLHCNSAPSKSEAGLEIYFLSEQASDPESQRVADAENSALELEGRSLQDEETASLLHAMAKTEYMNDAAELAGLMTQNVVRRAELHNRGVKQAAFYVLRGTNAPAVLVEMGFLSNPKDAAKLGSKKFRRRLVEGVYAGVLDFAKRRGWNLNGPAGSSSSDPGRNSR